MDTVMSTKEIKELPGADAWAYMVVVPSQKSWTFHWPTGCAEIKRPHWGETLGRILDWAMRTNDVGHFNTIELHPGMRWREPNDDDVVMIEWRHWQPTWVIQYQKWINFEEWNDQLTDDQILVYVEDALHQGKWYALATVVTDYSDGTREDTMQKMYGPFNDELNGEQINSIVKEIKKCLS